MRSFYRHARHEGGRLHFHRSLFKQYSTLTTHVFKSNSISPNMAKDPNNLIPLRFKQDIPEGKPEDKKSDPVASPTGQATRQETCKIISFPFANGRNDLADGIKQYHALFEIGFDFLFEQMQKRGKACNTFPRHCTSLHLKDIRQSQRAHYLAGLIQFENLITKLHDDARKLRAVNPAQNYPMDVLHDAQLIRGYKKQFHETEGTLFPYRELRPYYNPELCLFGEHVYRSTRYLQETMQGLSHITSLLMPSRPIESQAYALEACLERLSSDRDSIMEGVRQAVSGRKEWVAYVTMWYHKIKDDQDHFFTAWNELIMNPIKRVYTDGVIEMEIDARMVYKIECEKEQRVMLGLDYFNRILQRLNPEQPESKA